MSSSRIAGVALAGLLHDIGKFYQRTGAPVPLRNLESYCCPSFQGRHSHQHTLYTAKFLEDIFGKNFPAEIVNPAIYHHLPQNDPAESRRYSFMVTIADWLSSGERRGRESEEPGDPRSDPLISIFTRLTSPSAQGSTTHFPLASLHSNLSSLFPSDSVEVSPSNYAQLWSQFTDEARLLVQNFRSSEPTLLIEPFQSLLQKYTTFIPASAYKDQPDISLFHHLKSTAALAACLAALDLPLEVLQQVYDAFCQPYGDASILSRSVAYLVVGDFSGIQDFIYSITSHKALRSLRGRSLTVQLLSEAVANKILTEFALPSTNLLQAAGGHFYLLIPAFDDAPSRLQNLRHQIDHQILELFQGRLSLVLAYVSCSFADFQKASFGKTWSDLGISAARQKRRPSSTFLSDPSSLSSLLGPFDEKYANHCRTCGNEVDPGSPEPDFCLLCHDFFQIAQELATAKFIVHPSSFSSENRPVLRLFSHLSFPIQFRDSDNLPPHSSGYTLNSLDFISEKNLILKGFRFLSKATPRDTLGDLANSAQGLKRWGVLRADVDHLGDIFRSGLGSDKTLSRLATLSGLLALFFSAHIDSIAEEEPFRGKVYTVYSGGDDLFIIAPWDLLPPLAARIYSDFRKFTSNRLSLSAAIFIAPSPKFPIYQAASDAGLALQSAKDAGRNRLTLFDRPIPWDQLQKLSSIKDILLALLHPTNPRKPAPRSLLSTLYSIYDLKIQSHQKGDIFPIWRLFYSLKRLEDRRPELKPDLENLRNEVVSGTTLIDNLDIAVRWADYLTRKEEE